MPSSYEVYFGSEKGPRDMYESGLDDDSYSNIDGFTYENDRYVNQWMCPCQHDSDVSYIRLGDDIADTSFRRNMDHDEYGDYEDDEDDLGTMN